MGSLPKFLDNMYNFPADEMTSHLQSNEYCKEFASYHRTVPLSSERKRKETFSSHFAATILTKLILVSKNLRQKGKWMEAISAYKQLADFHCDTTQDVEEIVDCCAQITEIIDDMTARKSVSECMDDVQDKIIPILKDLRVEVRNMSAASEIRADCESWVSYTIGYTHLQVHQFDVCEQVCKEGVKRMESKLKFAYTTLRGHGMLLQLQGLANLHEKNFKLAQRLFSRALATFRSAEDFPTEEERRMIMESVEVFMQL